jgi:hypothetical protein
MKIITGENYQFECNHYLSVRKQFHPSHHTYNKLLKENKKIIYEDLTSSFDNKSLIFMETNNYYLPDIIDKLKLLKNPFSIVNHNSDHHFRKEHLQIFNNVPNLQKIYTQNCEVENERVIPIPIGLANSKWPHGNLSIFNQVLKENIPKKNKIYFHFNIGTNKKERGECFHKVKRKGVRWLPKTNYQNFLRLLKSHQFAISPPGNGVDCHRLWESLYMKVVPICKRSFLTEHFSKLFPIIILDDWDDLDISKLNYDDYSWENYDKLDFEWWKEKIINN